MKLATDFTTTSLGLLQWVTSRFNKKLVRASGPRGATTPSYSTVNTRDY